MKLVIILFLSCVFASQACKRFEPRFNFPNSDIYIQLQRSNDLKFAITQNGKVLQSVTLDETYKDGQLVNSGDGKISLVLKNNQKITFELEEKSENFSMLRISRNLTRGQVIKDCVDMEIGKLNWYGGPQNRYQYWPIEKATFTNYSYVTKETDNCAITERYWLNSGGVFFFVEDEVPLFIEQNSKGHENKLCFSAYKSLPYDIYDDNFVFNYKIGVGENSRDAHMMAVKYLLGKPNGIPDERMVRHPIWSTWAIYKTKINDRTVREFADNILKYKFTNSQFEIDDDWEKCYGALTFSKTKFPNIKELTDHLKSQGFRVTLWIHPFINKNCTETYEEAKKNNYLVVDNKGNSDTQWWNSDENDAVYIDFTNPAAAKWFTDRLLRLRNEDGIDSFKFDAGESSWTRPDSKFTGPSNRNPSLITTEYIKTVAKLGPYVEVRSGQGTQSLPIFLRMIDKDTDWTWHNGLPTLLTTLFQLNLSGYSFILPDMIGGNGYNNNTPKKEIFIRWLQANVFMPSLQFSYVPWQYDDEAIELSLKFTKLHDKYTDYIMERFKLVSETGEPVNPPLWWIDPEDVVAHQIYDQFLLGDKIIVAPVIIEGQTERDIYLPKGKWMDGNTNEMHDGPKWIMNYQAPLSVLPYFEQYESI